MLTEKEFFIRKAIGWVLRETSRRDPAWVAKWTEAHLPEMSGVTSGRLSATCQPATPNGSAACASREGNSPPHELRAFAVGVIRDVPHARHTPLQHLGDHGIGRNREIIPNELLLRPPGTGLTRSRHRPGPALVEYILYFSITAMSMKRVAMERDAVAAIRRSSRR